MVMIIYLRSFIFILVIHDETFKIDHEYVLERKKISNDRVLKKAGLSSLKFILMQINLK